MISEAAQREQAKALEHLITAVAELIILAQRTNTSAAMKAAKMDWNHACDAMARAKAIAEPQLPRMHD